MKCRATLTRRSFVAGSVAALPGLPLCAAPGMGPPADRAGALAARLAALGLPVTPARLDLVGYHETDTDAGIAFRAVIRLTWPPGERTRSIEVTAADDIRGHRALVARAEDVFCTRLRRDLAGRV